MLSALSEKFIEILQELEIQMDEDFLKNHPYFAIDGGSPQKCEDQFIAEIEINISRNGEGFIKWLTPIDQIKSRAQADSIKSNIEIPTIIIVLESPHVKEFFDGREKRAQPMPAMGNTGTHIIDYFPELLMKYILQTKIKQGVVTRRICDIENGIYRVALLNTIQYQCSIGEKIEEYKEKILSRCLNGESFLDDTIKRLKKLSPGIIINCCTIGKEDFRNMVQQKIDNNFSCLKLIGYHPSHMNFLIGLNKSEG